MESPISARGAVMAGSAAISLFMHWLRYNLRIDELESTTLQSELKFPKRMFFQTMAKVVKFRFIVNKKRKL